jgi:hypothetical protein
VVRDNLETLYGATDDGALDVRLPTHAKKELEAFLNCGFAVASRACTARRATRAGWLRGDVLRIACSRLGIVGSIHR